MISAPFFSLVYCQGLVVSTTVAGAFAGSLTGGSLADARGRRGALSVASGVLAVGALACAAAPSTDALLAGRALCGLGIGLSGAVAPLCVDSFGGVMRVCAENYYFFPKDAARLSFELFWHTHAHAQNKQPLTRLHARHTRI